MAVDASIPLQTRQWQTPDLLGYAQQAYALSDMADQRRARQQQQQQQMALRDAFQGADINSDGGQQDLVRKVGSINPDYAMKLSDQFRSSHIDAIKLQMAQLEQHEQKLGLISQALSGVDDQYESLVKQGRRPEEAQLLVQPAYEQAVGGLKQAGITGNMPPAFDPSQIKQKIQQGIPIAQQIQLKREQLQAQHQAAQDQVSRERLEESERHNRESEAASSRREDNAERRTQQLIAKANQGSEAPKFDQEDIKFLAQQLRSGDTSVLQNMGRGKQGAENIVAIRKEAARQAREAGESGADQARENAEFGGLKAGERSVGTRTAQVSVATNEAYNMADQVTEASSKVSRTNFMPINKALASYEKNTGSPEQVAFGAALTSFINAYGRAVNPNGTATVADKEHAREMLSTANSHEQVVAVINQLKKEMEAAKRAPGQAKQEMRDLQAGNNKTDAGAGRVVDFADLK